MFEEQLLTPIVPCPRCGQRFVEDPNRDGRGNPMPLEPGEEERDPPKCDECSRETFGEAFEADTLDTLERKLGLGEEDKKTLQAIKTLIENPDRIYMVVKVQDRVDELERRFEDRIEGIRNAVESKLDNANTTEENEAAELGALELTRTHESKDTQSPRLRFRALLTEGGDPRVQLHRS